jgi:NifU-like protein
MWEYTDIVWDHFYNPRNVGEIDGADGTGEVGSLACGDALKLTFKLDDAGRIQDAKFKTFGCASAIASSSVLTEMIKGMTLEEAEQVTNKQIADSLGGLPDQKMHCSVMGMEALEAAIASYRGGGKPVQHQEGHVICTCFGVTDEEIERIIKENRLQSVEEVTNYCKAGGGCGGCRGDIQTLLDKVRQQGVALEASPAGKRPAKLTNIQKMQLVQQTINDQVRPALRAHGGNIELVDIDGDRVIVAFRGMCAQCPTAEFTMRDVVEAKLREFVSESLVVEEAAESGEGEA